MGEGVSSNPPALPIPLPLSSLLPTSPDLAPPLPIPFSAQVPLPKSCPLDCQLPFPSEVRVNTI